MMRVLTLLGTPSVTLLALLLDLLTRRRLYSPRERRGLLLFAAIVAPILYSSTLGYLPFDVYRLGYSPWAPAALALLAIALAPRSPAIAYTALIALVAYDIPIFRSVNLFDYVVDPILWVVAWSAGVLAGAPSYTAFRTAASFSAKRAAS